MRCHFDWLKDLIDWGADKGFIEGIEYSKESLNGTRDIIVSEPPRVTLDGKAYLESLDNPIKESTPKITLKIEGFEELIRVLNKLPEGQKEIIKHLAKHNKILEEISFLKADEVTVMKEELEKLRNSDSSPSVPWDIIINLLGVLTSLKN